MIQNLQEKKTVIKLEPEFEVGFPVVSLFMPFEPKMVAKENINAMLYQLQRQASLQLKSNFTPAVSDAVLLQLNAVIKKLDYSSHKKSIAIFVTPEAAKVFYLDLLLQKKVMIHESYNIRSIVESKLDRKECLVLALDSFYARIYLATSEGVTCMVNQSIPSNNIDVNTGFVDKDCLKKIDKSLSTLLSYYSCPLFIVGSRTVLDEYKSVTENSNFITDMIPYRSTVIAQRETENCLHSYFEKWDKTKSKFLLQVLYRASSKKKLAVGINEVTDEVKRGRAEFLVIEKNYTYPVVKKEQDVVDSATVLAHGNTVVDVADDIIEKVLEKGGDVEFVHEGFLTTLEHIALIHR